MDKTRLQKAIEEIAAVEEAAMQDRIQKERSQELAELIVGQTIMGIKYWYRDEWELLLSNGTIIRFEYKNVQRSEWRT